MYSSMHSEKRGEDKSVSDLFSVTLPARPDSKVAKGTVHIGFNHAGFDASELIDASMPVTDLTVVSK